MSSARTSPDGGFTLIEVLVALAILAVSLVALLGVFGNGFHLAAHIRDRSIATSLAQSLLATTVEGASLRTGETVGRFADGFRWRLHIAPDGETNDGDGVPVRALQVSATVAWTDGRFERSVTLDTLRLAPKEKR
jgi:general secretion pathway protein I